MGFSLWGLMSNASAVQQEDEARKSTKWWLGTKSGYGDLFDAVFVAVPWHSSGISLLNTHSVIPTYDYVRLHVTILVTTAKQPDPAYFGRGKGDAVPTTILTSHISLRKAQEKKREEEKKKAGKGHHNKRGWWPGGGGGSEGRNGPFLEFNSLSYLQTINSAEEGGDEEHVVKIFSAEELSDDKLEEIFGKDQVKWIHRKEWDAYPCEWAERISCSSVILIWLCFRLATNSHFCACPSR
jgi:prenylcysteine oxidase/farnesylcysteine lyase